MTGWVVLCTCSSFFWSRQFPLWLLRTGMAVLAQGEQRRVWVLGNPSPVSPVLHF